MKIIDNYLNNLLKYTNGFIASGTLFVVVLILITTTLAFSLIGGQFPQLDNSKLGDIVAIVTNPPEQAKNNLQLYTFSGVTITPSVTSAPPVAIVPPVTSAPTTTLTFNNGCAYTQSNNEPEIFVGSDPAPGKVVKSGKIRVWVTDEAPPKISPNEVVDPDTGKIIARGDITAVDSGVDHFGFPFEGNGNYLWEPTIYVKPATGSPPSQAFCDAKNTSCTPHFPDIIKGQYSTNIGYHPGEPLPFGTISKKGPDIDPDWTNFINGPSYIGGNRPSGEDALYKSEYIWDTTKFGLQPGNYWVQFVIHDGDTDLGISCITIKV